MSRNDLDSSDAHQQRASLLGTVEVAAWLGVSREQVWKLWASGRLPGYKFDRHVRFAPTDVEAFLAASYTGTATTNASTPKPSPSRVNRSASRGPYHRI